MRDKNLRPNSKRAAKLRENTVMFDEMTPHLIMMGFPTVKWIDIAMFAVGLPSEVDQNASMFYIDAMEHLGLPADVCPEPAAECGVAVVDDYPRVGKCYFTGTMPCDGAISQTNILTRHFKDLPSFQITPPQRVNEPEVQTYAVKNLKKGIEFLEQQFGVKWDWDAFWKNAAMYNDTSRCMVEKWDVNCTEHPQVCGAALALQREYEFQAAACMDKFMHKTDLRVTKMMLKGYEQDKAANAPQPKYRCLVWACPAHYYTNFTYWTQHCWGVTCVNDMEAMLSYLPITIGDKEQALGRSRALLREDDDALAHQRRLCQPARRVLEDVREVPHEHRHHVRPRVVQERRRSARPVRGSGARARHPPHLDPARRHGPAHGLAPRDARGVQPVHGHGAQREAA